MRYEHTPRPEIEYHPHIRDLIEKQEKWAYDRTYHRDKQKLKDEREALIKDAKDIEVKDFWCDGCKKDFMQVSIKEVEVDWSNPTQHVAFYKGKHRCGKWCIRLITDRHKDDYWFKSRNVHADRAKHYADLIQPHETGFNMLYKKI